MRIALAALSVALPGAVIADEEPAARTASGEPASHAELAAPHRHVPLVIDPATTWESLLEATLAAHPRSIELRARRVEAEAWQDRSDNWLSAAPSLYFSYLSDRPLDDFDQREYEGGVELPLWRPGQRGTVRAIAVSAAAESEAVHAALELEVAGALRDVLWDVEAAAIGVAASEEARAVAVELLRVVERRHAQGDLPLADMLLAQTALLEREQDVVESRAALVDAERVYAILTGLDRRPAELAETPTTRTDYDASHPFLALANAAVERAQRSVELAGREARGSPTVAIGPRRQRDPLTTFYNDSLAVAVRVPVGGKSFGGTQIASSARLAATAEAERSALLRRLDLALHEAEHALATLEASLALAVERRELASRQWRMAQTAFVEGEIELRDLLRIQDTAQAIGREADRLAVERKRAIAAYNQAIGEAP